jgi:uncharacterized membrane protein (Fun14 family)
MASMSDASASALRLTTFQLIMVIAAVGAGIAGLFGMKWRDVGAPGKQGDASPAVVSGEHGRSFVSGAPAPSSDEPAASAAPLQPWSEWLGTRGVQIGFAFLGGFAIGFAFRAFLKTMAVLTALAIVSIFLLSYFRVINVDFTMVREQWNSNSEWILAQATKLKDVVWQYLPSSTAGVAGLIVGMVRK